MWLRATDGWPSSEGGLPPSGFQAMDGRPLHFADVAQQRQQQFRKLPGAFCPTRVRVSPSAPFRERNGRLKNS